MNNWNDFVKIEKSSRKDNLPIQIGHSIVVDGYIPNKKNAVFTHFHRDHIADIDDTLGYDKILLHPITYNVITALNSTRKWRKNLKPLEYRETHTTKLGEEIKLYDADHVPGSCQVHVKVDNTRILYSGDFNFPSADTPTCDILVLDASHGTPQYNTKIDKDSIFNSLLFTINEQIKQGHPVVISASRGSLQEIMDFLDSGNENGHIDGDIPFMADEDEIKIKNAIYRVKSENDREFLNYSTPEAYRKRKNKSKCVIFRTALHRDLELENMYTVIADKYAGFHKEHAFYEPNSKVLRINLLSHSAYEGILDYVGKNECKVVITDSSRSKYSNYLANAITKKFVIPAISQP